MKTFKEYLNEQQSKYIKDGFLVINPLKVGRGPHNNSSAYKKALALKKEKENTAAKAGQIQESGYIPDDAAIAKVMGPKADPVDTRNFTDFLRQNHAYFFTGPKQPLNMDAAHDEYRKRQASGKPTFITPAAIPSRPAK